MAEQPEIQRFVRDFNESAVDRISFAWNGEHADGFCDANSEFRRAVLDLVLADPSRANVAILRTLFEAETLHSKEAWSVHRDIHLLGEALLQAGQEAVILDFLRGMTRSFDTYLGCSRVRLERELVSRLSQRCREALEGGNSPEDQKLAEHGVEFFDALAAQQDAGGD